MRGSGPHVLVYDAQGKILTNFMAYDHNFRGGINVTTADADGDGRDEIITGPTVGAPHIQIFQIRHGAIHRLSLGFFAFSPGYRGVYRSPEWIPTATARKKSWLASGTAPHR